MKVNEVCVRKKQVRPGIYKALCDGYIRMRAGVYRVPVGTIIVPENDLLIVKTKHGSVCWRYELHRNWWIGRVLPEKYCAVKNDNQFSAITLHSWFSNERYEIVKFESDGILWVLQNGDKLLTTFNLWTIMEVIKLLEA